MKFGYIFHVNFQKSYVIFKNGFEYKETFLKINKKSTYFEISLPERVKIPINGFGI